jgi:hypothetical protein
MLAPPPAPSGPSFDGPSFSGPSGGFRSGPSIAIGIPPPIYGVAPYGVPYGYGYVGYGFFDFFWFIFIFFFIVIIIVAAAGGSSTPTPTGVGTLLTDGSSFPTSGNIYVTNNTGAVLNNVTFFTNNQQYYSIANSSGGYTWNNQSSFVIPLQSGSMIYASDSSNKIYGVVYSNVNGLLKMSFFGNGNRTNPFITYGTINPLNSTSTPLSNVASLLPNPITPPNTTALVNNMTFPTTVSVVNQSTTSVTCTIFTSITPGSIVLPQISINSGSTSSVSLGSIPSGGFAFIFCTTSVSIQSGIVLYNVSGTTFVHVLFGAVLTPTVKLFVPTGYMTLPIFTIQY